MHLRHHSPTPHINLHLQMQKPLRLHRSLVPALSDVGHSIPKSREPENLEIIAGMLCPLRMFTNPNGVVAQISQSPQGFQRLGSRKNGIFMRIYSLKPLVRKDLIMQQSQSQH